ncbi:hypothetical protein, partial [Piscirickettsia salmonis]|uniref:hypothetical protein n=1 Tax=Piscirickettsia salmonis TaxID=1238 RepID=UPI002E76607A
RGFIVVAFCSAILHHWMCKIPTEVATLTTRLTGSNNGFNIKYKNLFCHCSRSLSLIKIKKLTHS